MTRELLQQALDALESLQGGCTDSNDGTVEAITVWCPELIDALRSALAAPQPEPVTFEQAWATYEAKGYQYGKDALEQVRFGWEIAHEFAIAAPPAAPAPAAPPPIDNRFVAPGCEQFGTRADAESLLTMLRATLDEYMRLAAAPAVPRPDEFTCPYCFDQGAAPAVPLTDEQQIAIREAHCNTASDEYFGARPQVDDATKRRTYEAGFKEGWESGIGGGGNG